MQTKQTAQIAGTGKMVEEKGKMQTGAGVLPPDGPIRRMSQRRLNMEKAEIDKIIEKAANAGDAQDALVEIARRLGRSHPGFYETDIEKLKEHALEKLKDKFGVDGESARMFKIRWSAGLVCTYESPW